MRTHGVLMMLAQLLSITVLLGGCAGAVGDVDRSVDEEAEAEEDVDEAESELNVAQMTFLAGYTTVNGVKHYRSVNRLVVTGYNQNGQIATWSGTFPWTYSKTISNWWWDFDKPVYLEFDLRDEAGITYYYKKTCEAYKPWWQGKVSSVRYEGNGKCLTM